MFYVYILKMANADYYVGFTSDLQKRFKQHCDGEERTTKRYLPVKLEFYCAFKDKFKALKFEQYLKTGSGLAFRKRHLIASSN